MRLPSARPFVYGSLFGVAALASACQPKSSERYSSLAVGNPHAIAMPSGRTDLFVLGSDGSVWQSTCLKDCTKQKNFTGWMHGPGRPPGGATSDPGGVAWGDGRIDLFIRGSLANIWHQTFAGGRWYGWEDLDGRTGSYPIAASWAPGRLDLFVLCGDNRLWHRWCDAGSTQPACRGPSWSQWGPEVGGPSVPAMSSGDSVGSANGRIDMAVRGSDGALWFQRWDSNHWIGWRSLGGKLTSSPALVLVNGRLEAYAADESGNLMRGFVDSADAPIAWSSLGVDWNTDPRGTVPSGLGQALLISKRPGSHAFRGVACVPGAECTPID
ncbi:MAG TPA: hypothetical protein VFZ53_22305 [Polyangiaceae bacterium]